MTHRYDLVGIGNAIVDVFSPADDNFLDLMGIQKGIMQLIDRERAELLYASMRDPAEAAGGSVGNTTVGAARLGLKSAFIGRVNDDSLGRSYAEAMAKDGADFVNPPVANGELPTSRSMIFVAPDGERSMNTYLGISAELGPEDVADDVAGNCGLLFLEGYIYDKPKGMAAFDHAAKICQAGGGKAGISLSDPFCVDRHRGAFRRLVKDLDYVIGNQHEWESLYQTDLDSALAQAAAEAGMVVCTRSGSPVVILRGDERIEAAVNPVTPVDATGAGDQFAAGFLFGLARGLPLEICGKMGNISAAEVIGHYGARPEADIAERFRAAGLI